MPERSDQASQSGWTALQSSATVASTVFTVFGRAFKAHRGMTMSKNLYVGNLSFNTTADSLRETFEKFGTVTSAQVVTDRETGRPRGFAFVEMADGAEAAINGLNGTELEGRSITVNEARPRESRGGGDRGGRRGGGGGRGGYGR
jgi:RNA recognition motif-containing protein